MRDVVEDADGGRVAGIALGELELQMEDSAFIGGLFWSSDVGMPCVVVCAKGAGGDSNGGYFFIPNLLKVFFEPFIGEGM